VTDPSAARPARRQQLAIALDSDDLVAATRLARAVAPWFGVAKVGLELFSAAGPDAVIALGDLDMKVFVDLKLHDIPTTVRRAARVVGGLGATYLTLHAQGGIGMLRAGVEGLDEGAGAAGHPRPVPVAVTVLTSDATAPPHILPRRVRWALESGCRGIVVSPREVAGAKQLAPLLVAVTPGIRVDNRRDDHAATSTPAEALAAGADLLVVGRAVTAAADPVEAAAKLAADLG
jgi:orotidine-5'-phosphate decarboxylase